MRKGLQFLLLQFFLYGATSIVSASEPGQQFEGFNLQGYTQDGKKSWTVNGDNADILGDKIKISNVTAESYGDGKVNLTADTGTIDQVSGTIHLEKDVIITSDQGTQLTTDSLDWNRNEDLVKTEDKVSITDKDMTMTGTGMEAHPAMKKAQIEKDVTVTMDTEPKPEITTNITITSDGPMVMDQVKSYAVFQDNVVAVQADQTLKADRMELHFDAEKQQIKDMVCTGHVVIIRGANQSFADKAVYDGAEKRLTLSGRPKLILVTEGKNAITALGN